MNAKSGGMLSRIASLESASSVSPRKHAVLASYTCFRGLPERIESLRGIRESMAPNWVSWRNRLLDVEGANIGGATAEVGPGFTQSLAAVAVLHDTGHPGIDPAR